MSEKQSWKDVLENTEIQVEQKEIREEREVARVFVLQSADLRRIDERIAAAKIQYQNSLVNEAEIIANLQLTHSLWLEKGEGARNKGQVMAIGGGKKDGESLETAAPRELLEETHLRPTRIERLVDEGKPVQIKYHMVLKSREIQEPDKNDPSRIVTKTIPKKQVDNTQSIFIATILPSDEAYPLDPAEDKISKFHPLTSDEMAELMGTNTLNRGDQKLQLLDSFRLFPDQVDNDKIAVSFGDEVEYRTSVAEMMRALGKEARVFEAKKLCSVAQELLELVDFAGEEYEQCEGLLDQIQGNLDNLPEVRIYYSELIKRIAKHCDIVVEFKKAVERSNFKEEMAHPGNSKLEETARFAFLLSSGSLSLDEVKEIILEEQEDHPSVGNNDETIDEKDSQAGIAGLISILEKMCELAGKDLVGESIEQRLLDISKREKSLARKVMEQATGIEKLPNKLVRVQKFIDSMVDMGLIQGSADKLDPAMVKPLTNIMNADCRALLRYAFDYDNEKVNKTFKSAEAKLRLRFEALRALFLSIIMEPISRYYEEVVETGHNEIEELWSHLLVIDDATKRSVVKEGGNGSENGRERFMRRFDKVPGLLALQDVRVKTIDSLYRKAIVRGYDDPGEIMDIRGRSLVLAADPHADPREVANLFTRTTEDVTIYSIDKVSKELVSETKQIMDFGAVHTIIKKLTKNGAKILDYDPTNRPGESFSSAGPGGGDKICMAKFYICLETPDEETGEMERRFEEVQIFSPTEDGTTGFEHKAIKAASDAKYTIRRLTDTKGLRSFIELMFPARIYGDPMHAPYRKKLNLEKK